MSNEEVLTRKELKGPDRFQETATRAVDWITGHKKQARAGAIALAALAVAIFAGIAVSSSRDEKSGAMAYEVLRAAGAEVSPVPLPGAPGPFFATDAERQRAVVAEADRVIAEHGSSPGGRLALLMKGDAQYRLGEFDAAVASWERYLADAPSSSSLRFGALEGIALAREAAGKPDEAIAAWDRAAAGAPAFADQADLQKARLLVAGGKKDEARKLLEGFGERHKGSPLAADARDRLARLGAP